jgi:hypothetical protein
VIKTAGPITSRILRMTGFAGMVAPNGCAYLLAEHIDNAALRAHEQCHLDQMQRDGWRFWPRVVWYVVRYGYTNSPYEIECREAEQRAWTTTKPSI